MERKQLMELMNEQRQKDLSVFYDKFRGYDVSKFEDVQIEVYNHYIEGFDTYSFDLPRNVNSLEEIVDYVISLQDDRGGSWRFTGEFDEDTVVWFEVNNFYFEFDWV